MATEKKIRLVFVRLQDRCREHAPPVKAKIGLRETARKYGPHCKHLLTHFLH
ncbi:hypothetical protein [Eoetvoesiella caeni]|uniref:Uncharacterized protein n=1 Tax=Eoetvoesiella caeni TaxID=645616 RepID=A0A366H1P1_9BURK|nr:hypothetical protein [Eoetvoesiella caeni]MCI2810792.1 hypothetical protein [Eoetvoesiella caeni]NYT56690.1 hypothetical protein [Eoetvoesiella caeni]RBP35802.1 hypothetical protein DFR37_11576 [Eoetvoesiella caeni]